MKSLGTEEDTSSLEALDEEDGLNSEVQDEDLDPKVLLRIQKISDILNQTNLNLNVFEKMLPAYRSEKTGFTLSSDTLELSEMKIQNQNLAARVNILESQNEELEKSLLQSNTKVEELCLENTRLNLTNEDLKIEISDLRTNLERAESKNISDSSKKSESAPGTGLICLISSGPRCIESTGEESKDLVSALNQLKSLKQSRDSLKRKTKQLLRHYRRKREILQHRENQLISQKSGLVKLQNLHQNFQSSHIVVLDYLGSELGIISRLVGLLLETEENEPVLEPCSRSNLSSWYSQIETLIHWTKQTLVSLALRFSQSSESHVSLINRKLLSLTKRGGKSPDPGCKPLESVSDSISQCTLSQENTSQSLVQDLDTGLGG